MHIRTKLGLPYALNIPYLKEYKALFNGSLSPGAGRRVVTLQLLVGLVAHICMAPVQHNQTLTNTRKSNYVHSTQIMNMPYA